MRLSLSQRLLGLLMLVALGLGQVVLGPMGVRCTSTSGNTRIELACIRTAEGHCLNSCSDEAGHAEDGRPDSDHPATACEDEPLGQDITAAKTSVPKVSFDLAAHAVVAAVLRNAACTVSSGPSLARFRELRHEHPPGELDCLRTVILLV